MTKMVIFDRTGQKVSQSPTFDQEISENFLAKSRRLRHFLAGFGRKWSFWPFLDPEMAKKMAISGDFLVMGHCFSREKFQKIWNFYRVANRKCDS